MTLYTYNINLQREVAVCLDENGTLTIGWGPVGSSTIFKTVPNWDGGAQFVQTTDFTGAGECDNSSGATVKIRVASAGGDNMVDVSIDITGCAPAGELNINDGSYSENFTITLDPGGTCVI